MSRFRLTRLVRTLTSEILLIWDNERTVGQADIHYAGDRIYATVILEDSFSESDEVALRGQLDHDVVSAYLQDYERDDFVVTIFRGRETASYSDAMGEDDTDHEEEDLQW
jgi:hypothetical protein